MKRKATIRKNAVPVALADAEKFLLPTYKRQPLLFTRGRGPYVFDSNGKRYLDFLGGIAVNGLGHAHPNIVKVIRRESARAIHLSNLFHNEFQGPLAKKLVEISGMDRVFFSNSGTEAIEGALKLARLYSRPADAPLTASNPKHKILALEHSFHGRTFGAVSITATEKYRLPFAPLVPGVAFVKFNDVADLESKFDKNVCAIVLETIQGEGGIRPVSKEFLRWARKLTKDSGALLVLDEIQAGLGRTGKYFAYQHYGIRPDILTVAKPLAAGLPLGAFLTTNRVASAMHPGLHGTTFGGGPLTSAVALEFLKQLDGLLGHINLVGDYFLAELDQLRKKHASIHEIRGKGLMVGAELNSADLAKAVVADLLENGIIINRTHETVLRFLPPYIIKKKHVDEVVSALDSALQRLVEQTPTTPTRKRKQR